MRLLIDGNVILDVLQGRELHLHDSALIWKICETEQAEGFISTLTFANLVYVMRKELSPEKIDDVLRKLSLIFQFADLSSADLSNASALLWNDFEDAVQSVIAERIHADFIITRNIRDFRASKVMALTPTEYLARI